MRAKSTAKEVPTRTEHSSLSDSSPQPNDVPFISEEPDHSSEPDHYALFLAQQKQQEEIWAVNRAAKRQRVDGVSTDLTTSTSPGIPSVTSVPMVEADELRAKLQSKTQECEQLKKKVDELKKANAVIEKAQYALHESVCKVSTRVLAFSTVKGAAYLHFVKKV